MDVIFFFWKQRMGCCGCTDFHNPPVFAGPTKMDGTLYNVVNGKYLALAAQERGLQVREELFKVYNPNSNNEIFTAEMPLS